MARNYTIGEAVEIIAAGKDAVAIQDLGRRYPLLVAKVAKIVAGSNKEEVVEMFGYMPEYLSANKVNKMIKQATIGDGDAEEVEDAEEEEAPKAKKEKKAEKPAKAEKKAKKESDPYADMDAIELFKECKKRGIKAAPKKTAKYYVDLLKKADAEAADVDEEADDWDEEEEEAPKAKKKKEDKKPAKKAKKEEEPEEDGDEDEDDDDWDI